jgi:beta-xylosidase
MQVWNEPNCGFWSGSQQDYWTLMQTTYTAIKSVDSRLRVGGPATCQSQWINETIAFCEKNGVHLDFISTHEYPTYAHGMHARNPQPTAVSRCVLTLFSPYCLTSAVLWCVCAVTRPTAIAVL